MDTRDPHNKQDWRMCLEEWVHNPHFVPISGTTVRRMRTPEGWLVKDFSNGGNNTMVYIPDKEGNWWFKND